MSPEEQRELERRRRQRNYVLGGVLVGLAALFYLITLVRMPG
ncbi:MULTISPECIES: hypothetical protein [Pacificimonas]|nr:MULTISPECIES: hypothetical protein [Pacificimonas]